MRATVSFDVEVDRVTETMHSLAIQESSQLMEAASLLERVGMKNLQRDIEDVLNQLESSAYQLRQYRDMLLSFKNVREGNVESAGEAQRQESPSPIDMGELAANMANFEGFLDRIKPQDEGEEAEDDTKSKEG